VWSFPGFCIEYDNRFFKFILGSAQACDPDPMHSLEVQLSFLGL